MEHGPSDAERLVAMDPGSRSLRSLGRDDKSAPALFSSTFAAYITPAVPQGPAMAINGRRNKPIGPGGSTRRLHRCSSLRLKSHQGGTGPFRKVGLEGCTGGAETGSTRA